MLFLINWGFNFVVIPLCFFFRVFTSLKVFCIFFLVLRNSVKFIIWFLHETLAAVSAPNCLSVFGTKIKMALKSVQSKIHTQKSNTTRNVIKTIVSCARCCSLWRLVERADRRRTSGALNSRRERINGVSYSESVTSWRYFCIWKQWRTRNIWKRNVPNILFFGSS